MSKIVVGKKTRDCHKALLSLPVILTTYLT